MVSIAILWLRRKTKWHSYKDGHWMYYNWKYLILQLIIFLKCILLHGLVNSVCAQSITIVPCLMSNQAQSFCFAVVNIVLVAGWHHVHDSLPVLCYNENYIPMLIFSRCNTCGEYIYKGKKFNSRKETVENENYLGLHIFRFYIKCPRCIAEIAFKVSWTSLFF
jgi:Saf4/Yju2 protein